MPADEQADEPPENSAEEGPTDNPTQGVRELMEEGFTSSLDLCVNAKANLMAIFHFR